ncbi:hypothetical protein Vretimale_11032 [Volvox reticuliferus]|uniref:Agenet domain-containing protein n=1 Tax=Volvox reticuliferus TaxID=1737510 RepID=A0A8J4GGK6_9CHLO|nr:hypothetical protein Vretimale_11032 [Volvox reticuliferus]
MQVQDHVGIYQTPIGLDCIKWSQDNLIAVAAGQAITIFSPAALGGSRAFAPYRSIDTSVVAPGFTPKEWQDSPQFAMSAFYEVNIKSAVNDQGWRNIAWSPVGCTVSGGCYLAALSADFKVFLLAPPASAMSSVWHEVADVTKLFKDYMASTGWKVDCLAVDAEHHEAEVDGALRLRGGCSAPVLRITPAEAACASAIATTQDKLLSPAPQVEVGSPVLRLRGGGLKESSTVEADAAVDLGGGSGIVCDGGGSDGRDGATADAQPAEVQKTEDGSPTSPGVVAVAASSFANKAAACGKVATAAAACLGSPQSGTSLEQTEGACKSRAPSRDRACDGGMAGYAAAATDEIGSQAADAKAVADGDPPASKCGEEKLAMAPPAKRARRSGRVSWGAGLDATTAASDDFVAGSSREDVMASTDGEIGLGENGAAVVTAAVKADLGKPGPSGRRGTAGHRRRVSGPQSGTPRGSSGVSAAATQLREGDQVEVHNDEEGLTGGWFEARLVKLSAPQYCYGLVTYDELQVSEEPGSSMLTEWFPLPGCPRLLTPAAARTALPPGPDGVAYPVHSRRGYALRPVPPSQVAPRPVPSPLRLGMMIEVLHDSAWWTVLLVGVTGPPEAVEAAGKGTTMAVHGGDGQTGMESGVILHGRLLDGKEAVAVPLERSRAVAVWDPKTGSWSAAEPHSFLPARPHHFRDVMLLEGGSKAADVLGPLLVNRVEGWKEAPEGTGTELEDANEGASWAAAVEEAGKEMLRAFALEFTLLQLDGAWLWGVVRERLAALQGASHLEQLTPPSWAATSAITTARGESNVSGNLGQQQRELIYGAPPMGSTPGGSAGGTRRRTGRRVERESVGAVGDGVADMSSAKPAGIAGQGDASDLLDFSGIDPDTFRQYDTRPDPNKGGAGLERAAPGMIAKRYSALRSAADPATLRVYVPGERLTGIELQLFERAYGEFMHLYGSQMPEGADKRISTAAKQRCRQILHRSSNIAVAGGVEEGGAAGLPPGAAPDAANGTFKTDAYEAPHRGRGPAKRRRTLTDGNLEEGNAVGIAIKSEEGPREVPLTAAAAAAAAGTSTAAGRRRSATMTPAAATARSTRRGPGRCSSGRASDVAPVMDFSGIDPDTFRQYDTRPDPSDGGAGLEKVAPGMILSRWQALIATADPDVLRAYKPFEKMSGVELKMYDQAYGEFLHLYGDKLAKDAAKRINVEAKRRVRRQVRTVADEDEEDAPPDGSQQGQPQVEAAGANPLTTYSGRVARAAAVRATVATRRQYCGAMAGSGSSEDGDDVGDKKGDALPFRVGSDAAHARQSRPSGAAGKSLQVAGPPKRGRGVQPLTRGGDAGDGDSASEYSLSTEPEENDDSSGSDSLGDEEREDDESRGEGADGEEDVIGEEEDERPRRGRGRGWGGRGGGSRGGGGGRSRGGGNSQARPSSREEEDAAKMAVASDVEAATRQLFEPLAPAINLDDPQMLQKHGGYIIYKRYMELRGKCDPTQLPAYCRGEHLHGADLRMFLQAYGEFMKVFGALLPPGADKKIKTHTKSTIRRRVIQSHRNASDKPERAAGPAGSNRATPQQNVLWTGKRRQGVREAAGVQGTLFMGYGEGGDSEEGEDGALQAPKDGEGGDGAGAFSGIERWEDTRALWGRRSRLRYQVELTQGSAESGGMEQQTARQPSYAIRFYGYVKDDHRVSDYCRYHSK